MIQDREHAGRLLGKKLHQYKNANAVVVGIPHGGVCVAASLATMLSLPLEVMPCRKIKHPADSRKNIGSVSADEAFIHDCPYGVPQDYIYHQILSLRNAIKEEDEYYHSNNSRVSLFNRTVILVDDVLQSSDTMIACLRSIRRQGPSKIILAVPVVRQKVLDTLRAEADELVCLRIEPYIISTKEYFSAFPKIDQEKVCNLLSRSNKNYISV